MLALTDRIGQKTIDAIVDFGDFWRFTGRTVSWIATGWFRWRNIRLIFPQMYEIGVRSVPVVMITGTFVGMVLAVQAYDQFARVGLGSRLGSVINNSVVKELGPVLAAVMLAGRVGGALTAELGTMHITEQFDALRSMGADPLRYLVVPRFLSCLLMIPFLTAYTNFMGIMGGYFISVKMYGLNAAEYWRFSADFIQFWDIGVGLGKSVFFGGALGLIACYKGFTCGRGAQGVGRACTEGFVAGFITILVLDFFLGVLTKGTYDAIWGPGQSFAS